MPIAHFKKAIFNKGITPLPFLYFSTSKILS